MNSKTSTSNAGDGLMALVAAAVIFIVGLEAAFVAYASWLLLPFILLAVIFAAKPRPAAAKTAPAVERTAPTLRIGDTALSGG